MADSDPVQYPLRVPQAVMEGLRRIAKRDGLSLNAVMVTVLSVYVAERQRRREERRMRWVFDGQEYNTETAEVLAHDGRDRDSDELTDVLYRTPQGTYFIIHEDEEDGTSIQTLYPSDAYQVYLGLCCHVVAEHLAFDLVEEGEEVAAAP